MRLVYGLVSPTATYWLHYVAEARGLYRAEGLAVETVLTGSTTGGAAALASGRVELSGACPDQIVLAVEQGIELAVVGGVVRRPVSAVVARPDVRALADLRGRRVGMSDAVGGVSSLLRAILRRHGLGPGSYESVVLGGTPEQARALLAGTIDAALLTHPFAARLAAAGYRVLARTEDYWGAYAFTTLNARRTWAASEPAALIAFLRATIRAGRWLRAPEHAAEAQAILVAATGQSTAEVAATYDRYVRAADVLAWDAAPDAAGLRAVLDLLREEGLLDAARPPERYIEPGPWRAAQASLASPGSGGR